MACGIVVSYLLAAGFGYGLARLGLVPAFDPLPLLQFVALFAGGFIAGRLAGVSGFMNGVAVAVAFIVVWAILNAISDARMVQAYGPLALPPMNMAGVMLGDLLNLTAAAFGGWLGERKGS